MRRVASLTAKEKRRRRRFASVHKGLGEREKRHFAKRRWLASLPAEEERRRRRRRKQAQDTAAVPACRTLYTPPGSPGASAATVTNLSIQVPPARKINDHPLSDNDNPVPACLVVKNDEGLVCGGEGGGEWGGAGVRVGAEGGFFRRPSRCAESSFDPDKSIIKRPPPSPLLRPAPTPPLRSCSPPPPPPTTTPTPHSPLAQPPHCLLLSCMVLGVSSSGVWGKQAFFFLFFLFWPELTFPLQPPSPSFHLFPAPCSSFPPAPPPPHTHTHTSSPRPLVACDPWHTLIQRSVQFKEMKTMMVMLSRTKYYIIALIRMVSPGALTFVRQVAAFPGYLSPFPY